MNFEPLSQRVIGAAIEVHRALGPGFREELYENALSLELERRGIQIARQVEIPVCYRGKVVGTHLLDIVVEGSLILELKSVAILLDVHFAQLRAYLRAADIRVGLLMNFGAMPLITRRIVNKYEP